MDTPAVAAPTATPPHPLREFWGYFRANTGAVIGLTVIVFVLGVAVLADVVAPHSPFVTNNAAFLKPPFWQEGGSLTYPLGTDAIGRDILSRRSTGPGCRSPLASPWWHFRSWSGLGSASWPGSSAESSTSLSCG